MGGRGGPTPTPLQATSSRLLGEVRGEIRAQRLNPHLWPYPEAPLFSATQHRLYSAPAIWTGKEAVSSVLIDSKNPDSMELGQLGDEHAHQRHSVQDEMDLVVLGIEAGEKVPGGKG